MPVRKKLELSGHHTGVAVPLSALRSHAGCGIGEFADLPLLGAWCSSIGFDLIQILPVNDTGANPSPYSAVSAFALHHIYIRLQDLPRAELLAGEIETFRSGMQERTRVDFEAVLRFKLEMLRRLFRNDERSGSELSDWIGKNPWVRTYSIYKCLKAEQDERSWEEWTVGRAPTPAEIDERWEGLGTEALFHAWTQFHLDRQLVTAAERLEAEGVYLKGDIPILMSVDSADVWAERKYFDLRFRAGAPPDMFTVLGQMWGFPVYDWDTLEEHDFAWWRERLRVAARYYHAFRIDHVLGFFRTWSVPASEDTAVLGRYRPAAPLSSSEIFEVSGAPETAYRFTGAWTRRESADRTLGDASQGILDRFFGRGHSDDFLLRDQYASESTIGRLDEPDNVKEFLVHCHRDRTFLETDGGFVPAWFWRDSAGYLLGDETTRAGIEGLVEEYETRSKPVWLDNGRRLLRFVREYGDMLPCAEDLGVVPPGLRDVLAELRILSLKIERWEPDDDDLMMDPSRFPYLSVSTPGVHDLSTLRGWWEEQDWDREAFCRELGFEDCSSWLTTELAEAILGRSLRSRSAIRVFQLQDLFALTIDLRMAAPDDERINRPGFVSTKNWSYVMPIRLEDLPTHEISSKLSDLLGRTSPGVGTSTSTEKRN